MRSASGKGSEALKPTGDGEGGHREEDEGGSSRGQGINPRVRAASAVAAQNSPPPPHTLRAS